MGGNMNREEIVTVDTKEVYRNRWMRVREDGIQRGDGSKGIYGVVEKKDFAVIVALENTSVYLVEQFRYPVGDRFWELPQGAWEESDAAPEDLARAELEEETGLLAQSMVWMGHLYVAYGYSNQGYDIFLATQLEKGRVHLDQEEQGLVAGKFDMEEWERMILDQRIKDATTVAVYGFLKMKGVL
jgi:ADP-ribose pyrophosphatase